MGYKVEVSAQMVVTRAAKIRSEDAAVWRLKDDLVYFDDHVGDDQNYLQIVEYSFEDYVAIVADDDLMMPPHELMLLLDAPAVELFLMIDVERKNLTSWISLKLNEAKMEQQKTDETHRVPKLMQSVNCLLDMEQTANVGDGGAVVVGLNLAHDLSECLD